MGTIDLDGWRLDGWVHLRSFLGVQQMDAVTAAVDDLWNERPHRVTVDDLRTGRRCRMSMLSPADWTGRFKLNDLYLQSALIRDVLLSSDLLEILSELLGEDPVLCNSLNLERSSEQDNHVDALYMTPRTPGRLLAVWIALEDVQDDAGPLRLYPGSHLIPPYEFTGGGRQAAPAEMVRWSAWIHDALKERGIAPVTVAASAGDVIIWNGDLLHGAEAIGSMTPTRRSLVAHYFSLPDSLASGYRVRAHGEGRWIQRNPQATGVVTRALNAVERRIQKLRGAWRTTLAR